MTVHLFVHSSILGDPLIQGGSLYPWHIYKIIASLL